VQNLIVVAKLQSQLANDTQLQNTFPRYSCTLGRWQGDFYPERQSCKVERAPTDAIVAGAWDGMAGGCNIDGPVASRAIKRPW
jgi:hypothetical protein